MSRYETVLDRFYADMTNLYMEDTIDAMDAEDRDYSPVPTEYLNMSFDAVCDDIADYAMETYLAEKAREAIPYRWQ